MYEQALELIRKYDRIIIHRHSNPDGDAIGSQIGLKHLIRVNFPEKDVRVVGDEARRYSFMDEAVMDPVPDGDYAGALAVILDTSAAALISDARYPLAAETLRIDHHLFCETIAGTEIVDSSSESCCGMIAAFAEEQGLKLDVIGAKSLYTGMVTDSGRFRYDNTTPRTFRLAANLLAAGFDINEIYNNLYSEDYYNLLNRAKFTLKIRFTAHHVAYIYNTLADVAESGLSPNAVSRGMVGTMADIRGVNSWVNFTETEEGVWCEIRSSKYNINPIAVKYGGGGHAKASGATLKDRAEAIRLLGDLDKLEEENDL